MVHSNMKWLRHYLVGILLLSSLWLTGCGELEFGVETGASSGTPMTMVVPTTVAEIPENMVLVTVTPSEQATDLDTMTATPTAVPTETVTPTATVMVTPTAVRFPPNITACSSHSDTAKSRNH